MTKRYDEVKLIVAWDDDEDPSLDVWDAFISTLGGRGTWYELLEWEHRCLKFVPDDSRDDYHKDAAPELDIPPQNE